MQLATRESAILQASEACCRLYVDRGTTQLTVATIADAVGLSERTFYRYFPTKASTVKPLFDWTTATFNEAVTRAPGTLLQALLEGFGAMLGGEVRERTRGLFPLVFADPEMWSVFLRAVHDGEVLLRPVLASRTGEGVGSARVRAQAAFVAAATKAALETMVVDGEDAGTAFAELLDVGGSLLL